MPIAEESTWTAWGLPGAGDVADVIVAGTDYPHLRRAANLHPICTIHNCVSWAEASAKYREWRARGHHPDVYRREG